MFRSATIKEGILLAGALLALNCIWLQPTTVHAGVGLTIQPIKISQTLKPGDSNEGRILLTNASDDDVAVDIAVEDFIPTAGTETFQFVGRAPGVTTVRDWITINHALHFNFKKGDAIEVPYTIKAPLNAEPGSHFGVLFFKATRLSDTSSEIKVGTQVGVLTFVTIPGSVEQSGRLTDFKIPSFLQTGPVPMDLTFENTGTVHFEPKGTIEITNMFGSKVGSVPLQGYAVLPTGVKTMHFAWNVNGFLLGRYHAVATVYDSFGKVMTTVDASFTVIPIWYIVGFLVTLIVIFFILWFIKKKVKFSIGLK